MHTPQFVHVYPAWFWPSVLLRSSIGFAWTDCLVRGIKIPNLHGQIPFGCANLNEGVQTECCLSAILEGLWEAASIGTSPEAEAAESNEVNCLPGNTKEGAHQEISKRKRTPVWLTWVLEIQTDNGGWPREDKEKLVGQGGGGGESTKPGAWLTCKDNQLQTQNSWDRITQMCALDQAWIWGKGVGFQQHYGDSVFQLLSEGRTEGTKRPQGLLILWWVTEPRRRKE